MQTFQFFEIYPAVLMADFLRYFIAASAAYLIFWVLFIHQWSHRIIQKKYPKRAKMWMEFKYSMSTVFIFSLIGLFIVNMKNVGHTMIYEDIGEHGTLWLFASFAIMALVHDAYFYWAHRLMHHPKIFKHVHLVHHRSTNPSPWAAYSFHPLEAVVEAGIFPLIVFTMPVHGLVLVSFLIYMISRNVLGHLGIEFLPKWFLKIPFLNLHTTTTHHDLHHKNFDTNYGLYFTWWDKWFGTEDKKYHETFEEVTSRKREAAEPQKQAWKVTAFIVFLFLGSVIVARAQSVEGLWQTLHEESGEPLSLIRIEKKEGSIEGKVAKIYLQPWEGEDPVCAKCPGDKKGKKVIGMEIMWNFEKDGDGWTGGKILDPASGEVYESKLWLENETTLKVRGYAGLMNLFFRTQTWQKKSGDGDGKKETGTWETLDEESGEVKSLVKVFEKNGHLAGQVEKIFLQLYEGEDPVCRACPGDQKGQKIVGMTILSDFEKTDGQWKDGNLFDPGNGKTYTGSLWLESEDVLVVRGYLGPFFRTQKWQRVVGPVPVHRS